ncbi:hypothetical protein Acid345_1135 [Candidatus Koribacter versatilis Ellin345]|uniref:Uncharacterized protein n=1 Tax=Koribacter versatilis (strain Ellin345) TaxID=204669 RepID=Q1ISL2_KORVE|nr:hypothetical protein Acid345_1135 [Candidatus Koribacter versatilis Ellin345]
MHETLSGRGRLLDRSTQDIVCNVEYEIHIHTSLRQIRSGFPPVHEVEYAVTKLNPLNNTRLDKESYTLITEGEDSEFFNVKNLGSSFHIVR